MSNNNLITYEELERRASAAGYGTDNLEITRYIMDNDLAICDVCGLWGKYGTDIVSYEDPGYEEANYCQEDLPRKGH